MASTINTPTGKQRATRDFGGCKTCRRRHLKCDKTKPTCKRCLSLGLPCERSPVTLRWLISTDLARNDKVLGLVGDDYHTRQPLYSEECRQYMSESLRSQVTSTVSTTLAEIDDKSNAVEDRTKSSFGIGPFCVFRLGDSTVDTSPPDTSPADDGTCHSSVTRKDYEDIDSSAPALLSISRAATPVESLPTSLDFLQWADLFTCDTELIDASLSFQWDAFEPQADDTADGYGLGVEEPYHQIPARTSTEALLKHDLGSFPDLVKDAPMLLSHFNDEVINQMGSLPINEKSPWRILSLPLAIVSLSRVTLFSMEASSLKHAHIANLCALVAVSAFHLSLNCAEPPDAMRPEDYWDTFWKRAYSMAKYHTDLSLETESQGTNKVKYKEQLMALQATLSTSFLSGEGRDARHYLTEMEKLIRLRGLPKKVISRRARLLHHIYAWTRIVSESTSVFRDEAPGAPVTSGITLDNFLRLEPRPSNNDLNINAQKDLPSNAQDIHLSDSRQDSENMYMEIYGVPETWLSLVSQTTRLANIMDHLGGSDRDSDAQRLVSLQSRVSRLEDVICSFVSRTGPPLQLPTDQSNALYGSRGPKPHRYMVQALNSALLIFFYRRIRRVNPWILQNSVTEVIQSLQKFDEALERHELLGPGTSWPIFIAGAEAMKQGQRLWVSSWLDRAIEKSGFTSYKTSKEILMEVWKRRDAAFCSNRELPSGQCTPAGSSTLATWVEVCRSERAWPLLC